MATSSLEQAIAERLDDLLDLVTRLCRQPSVSAQNVGIEAMAGLAAQELEAAGVSARVLRVPGCDHPVVYGEARGDSPKTMLFYDHYDVQPAEPFDLWTSPPFEPSLRDGVLYARGVADNKGNIAARLAALRALRSVRGSLPVTVKFFLEGEEEVGSPHIAAYLETYQELFRADACIWEGGGVNWQGAPIVILGAKGMVSLLLEASTAARDLHSSWATVVPNAAWRLVWALSALKGADERPRIPGFADGVRPPTAEKRAVVLALPDEMPLARREFGVTTFVAGAEGSEATMRHYFAPTINIASLESGYLGEGLKTVLPHHAYAKLDLRMVPGQRPEEVMAQVRRALDEAGLADIIVSQLGPGLPAGRTPLGHPFVALVSTVAQAVYGLPSAVTPTMAATGPMYYFTDVLGLPTAGVGVEHPDCRMHAPDENIRLEDLLRGTLMIGCLLERFAE